MADNNSIIVLNPGRGGDNTDATALGLVDQYGTPLLDSSGVQIQVKRERVVLSGDNSRENIVNPVLRNGVYVLPTYDAEIRRSLDRHTLQLQTMLEDGLPGPSLPIKAAGAAAQTSDQAIVVAPSPNSPAPPAADRTATGRLALTGDTVVIACAGLSTIVANTTGTFNGTINIEGTAEGTNLWSAIFGYSGWTGAITTSPLSNTIITIGGDSNTVIPCGGYSQVRLRATNWVSGAARIALNGGVGPSLVQVTNPQSQAFAARVEGITATGVAFANGNPVLIGGRDGTTPTLARASKCDTAGGLWIRPVDIAGGNMTETATGVLTIQAPANGVTITSVAASLVSVQLLGNNAVRKFATLYNDSTSAVFVALTSPASATSFTVKMAAAAYYEVPYRCTSLISAIWVAAAGSMRVTEGT